MQYIFVHGLGQTPLSWDKTIENLSEQFDRKENMENCVCPNLSELLHHKDVNYLNLYTAFSGYCDSFCEPLMLCGLSLGGILALHYGIEHPYKVKSMVLIGAQYRMPKKLLAFQNVIFRFMPQSMFRQMGFGKQQFIALTNSMLELDFSDDLTKVQCPVLVVCGEKDKANMEAAKGLEGCLTYAQLCVIQNAGHEVNVDAPEKLAVRIGEFMAQCNQKR